MLQSGRWRTLRIIAAAVLLCGVLGGCSMLRLAYSQADQVAYWWLDSYVDFDGQQTLLVREGLAQWFTWNRKSQLPEYAALLNRAAEEALADTTPERACRWFDELRERTDAAVRQGLPAVAGVVATLRPEQLARLARKQASVNEELRDEYLQTDPVKRREASVKRAVERAEQLYGRLDAAQRAQVAAVVAVSPFDAERWLAERQRRQRDVLQTLSTLAASGTAGEAGTAALLGLWQRIQRSPDEIYVRYAQALERYNCDAAAQLHNATSAEQREALRRRLKGWEADLRQLAAK
jgi:hypothetical protein